MPTVTSSPRLRERDRATAAIAAALDGAVAGRGRCVLLIGEAGLGKTSLLDSARTDAAALGIDVGYGRGEQMEGHLPFGVVVQALLSLDAGPIVDALGADGIPVAESTAPHYRIARWLQDRVGRPVLLAFDDLHWADPDSLALVGFLARRVEQLGLPVAIVGTLRPWPTRAEEAVRALAGTGSVTIEQLAPLSRPAAAALLAERTGGVIDADAERQSWDLCQGNPLLVEQVALAIARGEHVPDARPHAAPLAEHVLLARFAGLDRAGLACARAGCVLGTTFRADLATVVADVDGRDADLALEGLWAAGLIADAGADVGTGAVRFVHPLFAQALYEDLAPVVRQRLHARCFEVLAERGFIGEAAEHAVRADLVGDRRAIDLLADAGRSAMRAGAPASAVRLFEEAARFCAERRRPELDLACADALVVAGRPDDAVARANVLLAEPTLTWSDRVAGLRVLGRARYLTGAADHGDRAFADAIDIAEAHDPAAAVQPLLEQSLSTWLAGGPRRALPLAARARELARSTGGDLLERASAAWGHLALESGDATGLAATDPILHHLDAGGPDSPALSPAELAWPWASLYQLGMNANYAERFDQAEEAFGRAADVVERAGAVGALSNACIHLATVGIRRGRLEQALADLSRAEAFADLTPGVAPYLDLARAEILLWMGRLDESAAWAARAEGVVATQWFARLWHAHVTGLRRLWQGDALAVEHFLVAEATMLEAGVREPCHMGWAGHAVTAHLAAGNVADAERVTGWLSECSRALPCRYPRVEAALGRARIAAHLGDDEADARFVDVLDLLEGAELPLQRIEALLAFGTHLRRAGRSVDARPHLADALAVADEVGADWLRTTAQAELALAGGRRRRSRSDPNALTGAERRVAALASAGHSNAEIARAVFLSVNTVETHLKRVYVKLGIQSRRQLPTFDA